jgi:hypothetical protein
MKKSIPAAAATVLGFGLKFIPVPKKSTHQDDIDKAINQFDRDFYLKDYFANNAAGTNDEGTIKKLQANSQWMHNRPPKTLLNVSAFQRSIDKKLPTLMQ